MRGALAVARSPTRLVIRELGPEPSAWCVPLLLSLHVYLSGALTRNSKNHTNSHALAGHSKILKFLKF